MICKGCKEEGVNCIFDPSGDGTQATCEYERCICCDPNAYSKGENTKKLTKLLKTFKRKHLHAYKVLSQRLLQKNGEQIEEAPQIPCPTLASGL